MQKLFIAVIVIGSAIGAIMPSGRNAPRAVEVAMPTEAALVSPSAPLTELRIDRRPDGHFYVDGLVNGEVTRFLVDTGASHIALTMDDAKRLNIPVSPGGFQVVGRGAGGEVRGQLVMLDRVTIGGRVVTNARAAVLEGLHVSLLGQSVLSQIGTLQMTGDRMILR